MKMTITLPFLLAGLLLSALRAQDSSTAWPPKSMDRPRPPVVTPAPMGSQAPPSDAIILFDGTSFEGWDFIPKTKASEDNLTEIPWKLENGYMEVQRPRADLITKRSFRDCQIHIEWATPSEVSGEGQGRGNSGVFLEGHTEIQVLDSYQNDTYPDGQAGALYAKFPPLVNASRKPGEWQAFDIVFQAPRKDGNKVVSPAQLTVFHNGIVIHHAVDPGGKEELIRIRLQDHNNPVRYRNIWVRELKGYDSGSGAADAP